MYFFREIKIYFLIMERENFMAFHENLFADLIMLVSFTLYVYLFLPPSFIPVKTIGTTLSTRRRREENIHKEDLAVIKLLTYLCFFYIHNLKEKKRIKVFLHCNNNNNSLLLAC